MHSLFPHTVYTKSALTIALIVDGIICITLGRQQRRIRSTASFTLAPGFTATLANILLTVIPLKFVFLRCPSRTSKMEGVE